MKAMIVTPYAEPERGACAQRARFFSETLRENAIETETVAIAREGIPETEETKRYSSNRELFHRVRSSNAKLVIAVSPPIVPAFVAFLASRISGKKFVLDAKDDPTYYRKEFSSFGAKAKNRAYRMVRKITYQSADSLLFLTDSDLEETRRDYHRAKNLFLVMNGTETGTIFPDRKAREETRKRLGIAGNETVFVYAGSVGDEKVPEMIDSFSALLEKNPARLLLLLTIESTPHGKKELEEINQKILENGLQEKAILQTNIPFSQINAFFSASDIALIPWPDHLNNSIPVKTFDYASAGLAIIARSPESAEISRFIREKGLGFHFSRWDEVVSKSSELVKDEKKRILAGKKNRETAQREFGREHWKKNLLQAIQA